MFAELHRDLRARIQPRRHTALLVMLVLACSVRPLLGEGGGGPIVFSLAVVALLLVALYATQVDELVGDRAMLIGQRRRRSMIGWGLAIPAIVERVVMLFHPSPRISFIGSLSWLAFFAFITWSEWRIVLKQKEVTSETISMAIAVYLLIGLTWGLVYIVIFQFQPQAFSFGGSTMPVTAATDHQGALFPVFIYFSLTTLSTIGFGDIVPLTLQARYAAVAEGITGQFFLAILVARLVGMQMMTQSAGPPPAARN
ncbi:MAG: potassium channel family protein [Candidatus Binatia bacterium]